MLRVLFLVRYPIQSASERYRVYQFLDFFRDNGVDCTVHSLLDERAYKHHFQQGHSWVKIRSLLRGTARRFLDVVGARRYDLAYVLKGAFPYGPPVFEQLLAARGIPFVFDFDDAIYLAKSSVGQPVLDRLKCRRRTEITARLATAVFAGNAHLCEIAEQWNKRVFLVEGAEDTRAISAKVYREDRSDVIVGWMGSPSTVKYLDSIKEPLSRLCSDFPNVRVRIVGGEWSAENVRVDAVEWSLERQAALLRSFDVGVMPLPNEEWSQGKCGGKSRQYMAAGVPPIATDIGYNRQLIDHGRNGFLVGHDPADWYNTLADLVTDRNARQSIGQAARATVEKRYSIEIVGTRVVELLRNIARETP